MRIKRAEILRQKKLFSENHRKMSGNPSEMQNKIARILFQMIPLRIAGG